MVRIFLTVLLVALPVGASAADEWTAGDTAREAAFLAVHAADWSQTISVANDPDRYQENNPIIGDDPSRGRVNQYFLLTGAGHAAIAYLLPSTPRKWWQYAWIGVQAGQVTDNYYAGVEFGF